MHIYQLNMLIRAAIHPPGTSPGVFMTRNCCSPLICVSQLRHHLVFGGGESTRRPDPSFSAPTHNLGGSRLEPGRGGLGIQLDSPALKLISRFANWLENKTRRLKLLLQRRAASRFMLFSCLCFHLWAGKRLFVVNFHNFLAQRSSEWSFAKELIVKNFLPYKTRGPYCRRFQDYQHAFTLLKSMACMPDEAFQHKFRVRNEWEIASFAPTLSFPTA